MAAELIAPFRQWISPYTDTDFDWDDRKSAWTLEERDFALAAARIGFRGICLRREDNRHDYGEIRFQVLCEIAGRIFLIVYTPRAPKCRIISLRRANAAEATIYHER